MWVHCAHPYATIPLQNDCLSSAERCYSQARLVALQLSLLQSGKCVLNLDLRAVHKFMEEQPFTEVCGLLCAALVVAPCSFVIQAICNELVKFLLIPSLQALIVADAYKQTMLADWVSPLYRRVVLAGEMRYLSEFKAVFTLTPIIMQELASRSAPHTLSPPPPALFIIVYLFLLCGAFSLFLVTTIQHFFTSSIKFTYSCYYCNTVLYFSSKLLHVLPVYIGRPCFLSP